MGPILCACNRFWIGNKVREGRYPRTPTTADLRERTKRREIGGVVRMTITQEPLLTEARVIADLELTLPANLGTVMEAGGLRPATGCLDTPDEVRVAAKTAAVLRQ